MGERIVPDLLWRDIGRRSHPQLLGRLGGAHEGGAKIRNFYVRPARDQDIGGLDVPVDDALPVCVVERTAALESDLNHVRYRQQALGTGVAGQIPAVHVLHRDVGEMLVDDGVQDCHDVRMRQLAGQRSLADELDLEDAALPSAAAVVVDLDGYVRAVELIVGQVDRAVGPPAQFPLDLVLAYPLQHSSTLLHPRTVRSGRSVYRPLCPALNSFVDPSVRVSLC